MWGVSCPGQVGTIVTGRFECLAAGAEGNEVFRGDEPGAQDRSGLCRHKPLRQAAGTAGTLTGASEKQPGAALDTAMATAGNDGATQ